MAVYPYTGSGTGTGVPGVPFGQNYNIAATDYIVDDETSFVEAKDALSAQGFGTMWIDGMVRIPDGLQTLLGAISIRGLTRESGLIRGGNIVIGNATSSPFASGSGKHGGTVLKTDALHGEADIVAPGLGAQVGDWLLIFSDNEITNRPWHSTSSPGHPAEMHQVYEIYADGSDTVYRLETTIAQSMLTANGPTFTATGTTFTISNHGFSLNQVVYLSSTGTLPSPLQTGVGYFVVNITNANNFSLAATSSGSPISVSGGSGTHRVVYKPRAFVLPIHKKPGRTDSNVIIDNLIIKPETDPETSLMLRLYHLDGVTISNVRFMRDAGFDPAGQINLTRCANVDVYNNIWDSNVGWEDVPSTDPNAYAVIAVGATNSIQVHHNRAQRCAHFFTTAGEAVGSRRYGDPLRVSVSDNDISPRQTQSIVIPDYSPAGGSAAIDTHVEGYGIVIERNRIYIRGQNMQGISFGGWGWGINARALRTIVRDNTIIADAPPGTDNDVQGVSIQGPDCIVQNNVMINCQVGVIIRQYAGQAGSAVDWDNLLVTGNTFERTHLMDTADNMPIVILGGNNHSIVNNTFRNIGGKLLVATIATGGLRFVDNRVFTAGTTGSYLLEMRAAVTNCLIAKNTFANVADTGTAMTAIIAFLSTGNNNRVVANTFVNCNATHLISFGTGGSSGTGHRVSNNEASKGPNTNFINTASLTTAQIEIIGNTADNYTAGTLGITGTNAATLRTAYNSKNWID